MNQQNMTEEYEPLINTIKKYDSIIEESIKLKKKLTKYEQTNELSWKLLQISCIETSIITESETEDQIRELNELRKETGDYKKAKNKLDKTKKEKDYIPADEHIHKLKEVNESLESLLMIDNATYELDESEELMKAISEHINLITKVRDDKELREILIKYLDNEIGITDIYNKKIENAEYNNLVRELRQTRQAIQDYEIDKLNNL
jgi:hypothetical protein